MQPVMANFAHLPSTMCKNYRKKTREVLCSDVRVEFRSISSDTTVQHGGGGYFMRAMIDHTPLSMEAYCETLPSCLLPVSILWTQLDPSLSLWQNTPARITLCIGLHVQAEATPAPRGTLPQLHSHREIRRPVGEATGHRLS